MAIFPLRCVSFRGAERQHEISKQQELPRNGIRWWWLMGYGKLLLGAKNE